MLNATSIVLFGKKHRGKTVAQVLDEDPSYILWAAENVKEVTFTPEIISVARDSTLPPFEFFKKDMEFHYDVLSRLEKGLDSKGASDNTRLVVGFTNTENLHASINYARKLLSYLKDELQRKGKLFINENIVHF